MIHVLKRNQEAHIILVENKKNQKRKINEKITSKFSSKKEIQYFKADSTSKTQIEKTFDFLLKEIYVKNIDVLKKDISKNFIFLQK